MRRNLDDETLIEALRAVSDVGARLVVILSCPGLQLASDGDPPVDQPVETVVARTGALLPEAYAVCILGIYVRQIRDARAA